MATRINLIESEAKILNGIRNNASENYKNHIATAYPSSLMADKSSMWKTFMDFPGLRNEFEAALLQRIAFVRLSSKSWENKLKLYKKGKISFGSVVEDVFVNMAKVWNYDIDRASKTVFKRHKPDIRSAFYSLNFRVVYPVTIEETNWRSAFLQEGGLVDLTGKVIEQSYNAEEYDEYEVMLYMFARKLLDGYIKTVGVDTSNPDNVIAAIRKTNLDFEFPTSNYNAAGVKNWTKPENKTVLMSTDFAATSDVKSLAAAFNLEYKDFLGRKIYFNGFENLDRERLLEIFSKVDDQGVRTVDPDYQPLTDDEINALKGIPAFAIDEDFFQIYDYEKKMLSQPNAEGDYNNYFYHVWKSFNTSPFEQCVAFVPGTPAVSSLTISPYDANGPLSLTVIPNNSDNLYTGNIINFIADVSTSYFAPKAVNWEIVDSATIGETTYTTTQKNKWYIDGTGNLQVSGIDVTSGATACIKCTSVFDSTKTKTAVVQIGLPS